MQGHPVASIIWRLRPALIFVVLLAGLAACSGGGDGADAGDRTAQFKVTFAPDPVDASYDGRNFWWRYEVAAENVSEGGLHLAGFYINNGDGKWRWHNSNLPYPPGRRLRLWGDEVLINPAKVLPGARRVHSFRFVVIDTAGQFEVPASIELRF
jgi:hypothetical protein